jgi:hypothetical protein
MMRAARDNALKYEVTITMMMVVVMMMKGISKGG